MVIERRFRRPRDQKSSLEAETCTKSVQPHPQFAVCAAIGTPVRITPDWKNSSNWGFRMKKIGLALAVLLAASSAAEATDLEFKITGNVKEIRGGFPTQALQEAGGYKLGESFTETWIWEDVSNTPFTFDPNIRRYTYENASSGIFIFADVFDTSTFIGIILGLGNRYPKFSFQSYNSINNSVSSGSEITSLLTGKVFDAQQVDYLLKQFSLTSIILEGGNLSISAVTPVPGPELGLGLPALAIVAGFAFWSRRRSAAAA
ncbi:hypothetical protein [Chthonobacter albigriseus]|uniref:hypothetical protein n=1 Tax=Chthonobacter albigriseus TaxID=1683161 RepID=UPI0015EF0A82|nr:hypothetical protein [Chthonobacter albigriseus]